MNGSPATSRSTRGDPRATSGTPARQAHGETGRRFLTADGELGRRFGNETIRVTPDREGPLKLPAPLAHLADNTHGRYALAARVAFPHRGGEWRDRVVDHLAAWRLDEHGNPSGAPHRFAYDLSGSADHRDARLRHALTRLPHGARTTERPTATRHYAAAVAIGRRSLGHRVRRRTAPPPHHQSDRPHITRAMVWGIGQPRPGLMADGTRETAAFAAAWAVLRESIRAERPATLARHLAEPPAHGVGHRRGVARRARRGPDGRASRESGGAAVARTHGW